MLVVKIGRGLALRFSSAKCREKLQRSACKGKDRKHRNSIHLEPQMFEMAVMRKKGEGRRLSEDAALEKGRMFLNLAFKRLNYFASSRHPLQEEEEEETKKYIQERKKKEREDRDAERETRILDRPPFPILLTSLHLVTQLHSSNFYSIRSLLTSFHSSYS